MKKNILLITILLISAFFGFGMKGKSDSKTCEYIITGPGSVTIQNIEQDTQSELAFYTNYILHDYVKKESFNVFEYPEKLAQFYRYNALYFADESGNNTNYLHGMIYNIDLDKINAIYEGSTYKDEVSSRILNKNDQDFDMYRKFTNNITNEKELDEIKRFFNEVDTVNFTNKFILKQKMGSYNFSENMKKIFSELWSEDAVKIKDYVDKIDNFQELEKLKLYISSIYDNSVGEQKIVYSADSFDFSFWLLVTWTTSNEKTSSVKRQLKITNNTLLINNMAIKIENNSNVCPSAIIMASDYTFHLGKDEAVKDFSEIQEGLGNDDMFVLYDVAYSNYANFEESVGQTLKSLDNKIYAIAFLRTDENNFYNYYYGKQCTITSKYGYGFGPKQTTSVNDLLKELQNNASKNNNNFNLDSMYNDLTTVDIEDTESVSEFANKYSDVLKTIYRYKNENSSTFDLVKESVSSFSKISNGCIDNFYKKVKKNGNYILWYNTYDKENNEKYANLLSTLFDIVEEINYVNDTIFSEKIIDNLETIALSVGITLKNTSLTSICDLLFDKEDGMGTYIYGALTIIKIAGSILVVVLTGFDSMKFLASGKEEEKNKFLNHIKTRLICLAILLLVPTIIQFLLDFVIKQEICHIRL